MKLTKPLLTVAAVAATISTTPVNAELFKGTAELGLYHPTKASVNDIENGADDNMMGLVSVEHPVPLIPNVRIDAARITTSTYEFGLASGSLYYQVLDNGLVDLDVGFGGTALYDGIYGKSTDINKVEFDSTMVHAFVEATVSLPFNPNLSVYANLFKMTETKVDGQDYKVGVKYTMDYPAISTIITSGFRQMSFDFDNLAGDKKKVSNQGVFIMVGLSI